MWGKCKSASNQLKAGAVYVPALGYNVCRGVASVSYKVNLPITHCSIVCCLLCHHRHSPRPYRTEFTGLVSDDMLARLTMKTVRLLDVHIEPATGLSRGQNDDEENSLVSLEVPLSMIDIIFLVFPTGG